MEPSAGPSESQLTSSVLMVRPARFGANPETAASNVFQSAVGTSPDVWDRAKAEFDSLAEQLALAGISVEVIEDTPEPAKPDAVFPNNWFSTHANGSLVLYPLLSAIRRWERRADVIEKLRSAVQPSLVVDLTPEEESLRYLEGTGSLVLDRTSTIAYAALSPRTDLRLVERWCALMQHKPVTFSASHAGQQIYHTNVVMAVGQGFAAAGLASIEDRGERASVAASLKESGREVIDLRPDQIASFAGNMIHLASGSGSQVLVMSSAARSSLDQGQLRSLERHGELVSADLTTIESYGGGSARCMIAELFTAAD